MKTIKKNRTWIVVVGARPNFMKAAPILNELRKHPDVDPILVHTGQHYTRNMSEQFFSQLNIPKPDINLNIGSGSHAFQTAEIMKAFEHVLLQVQPELVIVLGDVNSTLACALTAVKLNIKTAHVEAGLRSFDPKMPEEINRKLTDAISDLLFTTEPSAQRNLENEGIAADKIFFVGNTMIDTLKSNLETAEKSTILQQLGLKKNNYALLTLHRPSNVDKKDDLINICSALKVISQKVPIVFPAHPRTIRQVESFDIPLDYLTVVPPLGYHDFLRLMSRSICVLTDSGGIQEEVSVLEVPCLTLRENTERPVTVDLGTNQIVGTNLAKIAEAFRDVYSKRKQPRKKVAIKYWDGNAAQRIVSILNKCFTGSGLVNL